MIGLAGEDAPADFVVGGGEEDLSILRWSLGYCSTRMDGFVVRAAPVSCTMLRLKQARRDNVNLSGMT